MLRQIVLCSALILFGAETARSACPGQTGKPIFSDDFSDDSGGWDADSAESYVPGALQIKTSAKTKSTGSTNQTFSAVNADYCEVMTFATDKSEANNTDYLALIVLAADYQNRFQLTVYNDGTADIARLQANNWLTLFNRTKVPSINTDPGSENTLRIIVKDQKMTFFVNGVQIKALRAQTPDGSNKFGFFGGNLNPVTKDRVYTVKSFSVTEAP